MPSGSTVKLKIDEFTKTMTLLFGITTTFLRADKGFFPSVQPLVCLQLTTLDKCLPAVWVVAEIGPLSWLEKEDTVKVTAQVVTQVCSYYTVPLL